MSACSRSDCFWPGLETSRGANERNRSRGRAVGAASGGITDAVAGWRRPVLISRTCRPHSSQTIPMTVQYNGSVLRDPLDHTDVPAGLHPSATTVAYMIKRNRRCDDDLDAQRETVSVLVRSRLLKSSMLGLLYDDQAFSTGRSRGGCRAWSFATCNSLKSFVGQNMKSLYTICVPSPRSCASAPGRRSSILAAPPTLSNRGFFH